MQLPGFQVTGFSCALERLFSQDGFSVLVAVFDFSLKGLSFQRGVRIFT